MYSALTCCLTAIVFLLALLSESALCSNLSMTMPMGKGTYWLYEGTLSWQPAGSSIAQEKHIRLKMLVLESINHEHVRAVLLEGHPHDLAWYSQESKPHRYVLVKVGSSRYYLLASPKAETLWKELKEGTDAGTAILSEDELVLEGRLRGRRGGNGERIRCDEHAHGKVHLRKTHTR